jgi:hypothetical protein
VKVGEGKAVGEGETTVSFYTRPVNTNLRKPSLAHDTKQKYAPPDIFTQNSI